VLDLKTLEMIICTSTPGRSSPPLVSDRRVYFENYAGNEFGVYTDPESAVYRRVVRDCSMAS